MADDGPAPLAVSGVPGWPSLMGGGTAGPWHCTTVRYFPPSTWLVIEVTWAAATWRACLAILPGTALAIALACTAV
jgi:hypothetical protein